MITPVRRWLPGRITPRAAMSSATSRSLRQQRPEPQMPSLMLSTGNRWRWYGLVAGRVCLWRGCQTRWEPVREDSCDKAGARQAWQDAVW